MPEERELPPTVEVLRHPLVRHKLCQLRRRSTSTAEFRRITREVATLMAYEAMRDLPLEHVEIETPLEPASGEALPDGSLCFVSVLRAGGGMLDGMLDLVPDAAVGHIGLARDPTSLRPVEYYRKLPERLADRCCIVVDPMLATGYSAAAAVDAIKHAGASRILFVCLIGVPEGLHTLSTLHPDVRILIGAVDRELDGHGYIRPGLGDAGDRMFGTS